MTQLVYFLFFPWSIAVIKRRYNRNYTNPPKNKMQKPETVYRESSVLTFQSLVNWNGVGWEKSRKSKTPAKSSSRRGKEHLIQE